MNFNRIAIAALTLGALGIGSMSLAAESNNPLDPSYRNAVTKLRDKYIDMLKKMDSNMDGMITEEEFIMKHDPLSPEFKKRSADFKEMLRMMDKNGDGMISLEEYMASANPLHPQHKFTSKN